jgi:hypothetical protein
MNYLMRFLLIGVLLSFTVLIATILGATPTVWTALVIITASLVIAYITRDEV